MDLRIVYILPLLGFVQCQLLNLKCNGIKEFTERHNARRLLLAQGKVPGQPAASKMNSIIWDDELAAKAAGWASKNQYGHNPDNTIPSNRFGTGENIYKVSTNNQSFELDLDAPMKAWFDEYKQFHYKKLESSDFSKDHPAIGHYTQMAWSNSVYLGCAVYRSRENDWVSAYVVCNYGPAGNYINQTPYQSGTASGSLSCGAKNCDRSYGEEC